METKTNQKILNDEEKLKKLKEVIEKYKGTKGALIPVLQEAQSIYGYLPLDVQKKIAQELDVPLSEIYGVATFYSFFTLKPKGKYQIKVCLGTACYVKGAASILEELKEQLNIGVGDVTPDLKFSLDGVRCVGSCGLAPVMFINDEVYGRLTPDKIKGILDKYK
ncbi:MAG: NADP-reducing hydrogenase subunit HndA [Thermosediminibacterales bacterium]|nr:NADP-reducing hydrogenase subunit HndA [Thermosediminibacterales bacterium]